MNYSQEAMLAYAALYQPYNDIDIFVEDHSLVGLYERLFQNILNGIARITSVTPLHGRRAVIEEATRLKRDVTRRRFFLIDGDFVWSTGRINRIRNLYTLRCYCFENLAWHPSSIHDVALVLAPGVPSPVIENAFSEARLNSIVQALLPLFIAYAICFKLNATCETVQFSAARLTVDGDSSRLCPAKIRKRIIEVYRHVRTAHGLQQLLDTRRFVEGEMQSRQIDNFRFISAKDYLFKILLAMFQTHCMYRGNIRQLVSLILDRIGTAVDPGLRRSVRRAARF